MAMQTLHPSRWGSNGAVDLDSPPLPDDPLIERSNGHSPAGIVVRLQDVQPEAVQWLWQGRIPLGKLTVLDGDPGLGKTTMALDIAARVSTGGVMPDGSPSALRGPAGVVLLTAEDGLGDTIRPRLDAAGGDVSRIVAIEGVRHGAEGDGDDFEIPTDIPVLEATIQGLGVRLVMIDPLMAFLAGTVDSNADQKTRRALRPLAAMAERTGAAVLVLRHLNKGGGTNAIYRGGGTIGIIGAARSGLLVARDPDDESGDRRVLVSSKSNLGAPVRALVYRTEPVGLSVRIRWEGTTSHTASQLLAAAGDDEERRGAIDEAASFLLESLADGPRPSTEIQKEARSLGISEATLRRAKAKLGVSSRREGFGSGGTWILSLPSAPIGAQERP